MYIIIFFCICFFHLVHHRNPLISVHTSTSHSFHNCVVLYCVNQPSAVANLDFFQYFAITNKALTSNLVPMLYSTCGGVLVGAMLDQNVKYTCGFVTYCEFLSIGLYHSAPPLCVSVCGTDINTSHYLTESSQQPFQEDCFITPILYLGG